MRAHVRRHFLEMSILKYFHLSVDETDKKLPDPHGSLYKEVPLSSIQRANAGVAPIIERQESGQPNIFEGHSQHI